MWYTGLVLGWVRTGLPQVRKWSEESSGHEMAERLFREKSRNFIFESVKIDILVKSQEKWHKFNTADFILSLASKREHVMPKHALIGCQTWHDWLSNIWSLADRNENFRAQNVYYQQIRQNQIIFYGYTRSKITLSQVRVNSLKTSSMPNLSAISCPELLARKFAPQSAKRQMFDDQSCHVGHPNVAVSRVHA